MNRERSRRGSYPRGTRRVRRTFAFGDLSISELGDDVLEVGPGPGMTSELFAPRLSRLTLVEPDPELVNELEQKFASTNVEVLCADGTATSFADGRFSGVVMFTMCHHVPTADLQNRLFREALRVLRPGGLLVASDSVASPELEALHEGDIYNPIDPATFRVVSRASASPMSGSARTVSAGLVTRGGPEAHRESYSVSVLNRSRRPRNPIARATSAESTVTPVQSSADQRTPPRVNSYRAK